MRILDIDLDLFMNCVKRHGNPNIRPTDDEMSPWSEQAVRHFLEAQCGLNPRSPKPGAVFEEHDELFYWLREEIARGTKGFDIYHADAHADLGIGMCSTSIVEAKWLARPPARRIDPPTNNNELNNGSWLLYAVACRWVTSIVYIHHPSLPLGGDGPDIPLGMIVDEKESPDKWMLQLRHLSENHDPRRRDFDPVAYEPAIPIRLVSVDSFKADVEFDRVFLTHSPGYTPPSADPLMDVILQYIFT